MTSTTSTKRTGYAPLNGLQLYYEIHGSGDPLIVLHGGIGSVEMFGENLALLARTRQVIGVDLRAHGRTADTDQPLSCELMADDIAALIAHLGFATADVLGYSLGGGVALQTAIRHPERVRKLVVVSAAMARAGWFPEVLAGFDAFGPELAEMMKPSPVYAFYQKVAPRPEDFPRLRRSIGLAARDPARRDPLRHRRVARPRRDRRAVPGGGQRRRARIQVASRAATVMVHPALPGGSAHPTARERTTARAPS